MLPNIDPALYSRFKREGYRIKKYRELPVLTIPEIVQLAYLDVNRTIRGIQPAQSHDFKKAVIVFIEHLLADPPASQVTFDQLHDKCCQKCLGLSCSDGAQIHYGQAQKLVNMALKYLYNEYARYKREQNRLGFPDSNVEQWFHLPIDSQIRDSLVGQYHFTNPTRLPWSQWHHDHYTSFQDQVRKRLKPGYWPLEIDYLLWNTKGASVGDAMTPTIGKKS